MNVITNNKWIGQRTIRPDGADKVTGRAAFAADTTMPGMIWGKVLRSPHPHARIISIDTSKAEALPGVKAVVTARDIVNFPIDKPVILGIQDMRWMCRNVMAREKALFLDAENDRLVDREIDDVAREGAVPRPPGRCSRRHVRGDCGKSLRTDRG
jgi:xanthine dehydrogenase molybdopterin-binding subunit B